MFNTFINSYKVSFAENANIFISFLKRVPIIGKKFPDSLYGRTDIKLKIGLISTVANIIFEFFRKGLYVAILALVPALLMKEYLNLQNSLQEIIIYIFIVLSFVFGSIVNSILLKLNKDVYNMIILMRANPKDYYLSEIMYKILSQIIFFLPVFLILGFGLPKTILVLIELSMCRIIGEWIGLSAYKYKKININRDTLPSFLMFILSMMLAYGVPAIKVDLTFINIMFNPIFTSLLIIGAALCGYFLWNFKGYRSFSREIISKEVLFNNDEIIANMHFIDVKIDDKKMGGKLLNTEKFSKKDGYDYLNELFFYRHKKIVDNAIKLRLVLISIVFIIALLVIIFIEEDINEKVVGLILNSTTMTIFIMYMMSTTERICKAMFFNCDHSFLKHGYYRESNAILSNFKARLKRIVYINSIPALAIALALEIIVVICGDFHDVVKLIPTLICIVSLATFFSIYHLFMYYVLQPYTEELTVKSPLFKIANFVIYMIAYGSLQVETSSTIFTVAIIGITVIFIPIALIVINKVAPRTFRLK